MRDLKDEVTTAKTSYREKLSEAGEFHVKCLENCQEKALGRVAKMLAKLHESLSTVEFKMDDGAVRFMGGVSGVLYEKEVELGAMKTMREQKDWWKGACEDARASEVCHKMRAAMFESKFMRTMGGSAEVEKVKTVKMLEVEPSPVAPSSVVVEPVASGSAKPDATADGIVNDVLGRLGARGVVPCEFKEPVDGVYKVLEGYIRKDYEDFLVFKGYSVRYKDERGVLYWAIGDWELEKK